MFSPYIKAVLGYVDYVTCGLPKAVMMRWLLALAHWSAS